MSRSRVFQHTRLLTAIDSAILPLGPMFPDDRQVSANLSLISGLKYPMDNHVSALRKTGLSLFSPHGNTPGYPNRASTIKVIHACRFPTTAAEEQK